MNSLGLYNMIRLQQFSLRMSWQSTVDMVNKKQYFDYFRMSNRMFFGMFNRIFNRMFRWMLKRIFKDVFKATSERTGAVSSRKSLVHGSQCFAWKWMWVWVSWGLREFVELVIRIFRICLVLFFKSEYFII